MFPSRRRGGRRCNGALPGAGAPQDVFDHPADVAWDADGNIFVADGIGNNTRIAKFTNEGVFIKSWGSKGTEPASSPTSIRWRSMPRAMSMSPIRATSESRYSTTTGRSRPTSPMWAIRQRCASPPARIPISTVRIPIRSNDIDSGGEIYKLELDGTVVGKFGRAGKLPKEFGTVNEIDCRMPNQLYVAEIGNYRVQKLTLR